MFLAFVDEYGDVASYDDVDVVGFSPLRDDALVQEVEPLLHQHCHVHDLVGVRLLEDIEVADEVVEHELYDFVAHERIQDVQELVHVRVHLIGLIQLVHVRHDLNPLHGGDDLIVNLETEEDVIDLALKLHLHVLGSLYFRRYVTLKCGDEQCADEYDECADNEFFGSLWTYIVTD